MNSMPNVSKDRHTSRCWTLITRSGWLTLCVIVGLCSSCGNWSSGQVEETKRRGDVVREALSHYRKEIGTYPISLERLVPKYLDQVPAPSVGNKKWTYEVFKAGASYLISVEIRSEQEPLLQATSDSGWVYDTK